MTPASFNLREPDEKLKERIGRRVDGKGHPQGLRDVWLESRRSK